MTTARNITPGKFDADEECAWYYVTFEMCEELGERRRAMLDALAACNAALWNPLSSGPDKAAVDRYREARSRFVALERTMDEIGRPGTQYHEPPLAF